MTWLANDVALITGGGSGLGRALVGRFLKEGCKVVVLEASEEKAAALARDFGEDVVPVHGDVRSLDDNRRAVAAAVEHFGRLDILVGNAGIMDFPTLLMELPAERLDAAFDEVMGVNVKGYILAAYAAAPELLKTRGCMLFTASSASFIPGGGGIFYTASKHAVVGVVRELAYQFAPDIRVNGIGPGPMRSDLRGSRALDMQNTTFSPATPEIAAGLKDVFPLQCMDPEDYTGLYVALASRGNAATTTGEVINAADGLGIRGTIALTGAAIRARR
jgi:2,3-dihydroxy-2,3-dihydrophenylpropionate dehydrogenase/cis-2,3-dihydrobiphenyl-2,3-diol dehydrogenase